MTNRCMDSYAALRTEEDASLRLGAGGRGGAGSFREVLDPPQAVGSKAPVAPAAGPSIETTSPHTFR